MNSKIPQDWKIWAEENIHNGSDPEELIDEMIKAGFDESLSKKFISSIKIDKDAIEIGRLRYRDFENKRVIDYWNYGNASKYFSKVDVSLKSNNEKVKIDDVAVCTIGRFGGQIL